MSKWADILKKNIDKKIEKKKNQNMTKESKNEELSLNSYYLDEDDEFNMNYNDSVFKVIEDLKSYCKENCLPFLDKRDNRAFSLYDFIKYNCSEWDYICDHFYDEESEESSYDSDDEYYS